MMTAAIKHWQQQHAPHVSSPHRQPSTIVSVAFRGQVLPNEVTRLILRSCTLPGLPLAQMTCKSLNSLVTVERPRDPESLPHLKVPRDALTVQEAINRAPPGAVIVMESGVYHERIRPDGVCIVGSREGQVVIADGCEAHRGPSFALLSAPAL